MKRQLNQSDLKYILHYFAPAKHQLYIFDPSNKLDGANQFNITSTDKHAPKVLVSLSNEICQYKDLALTDFDLIIDFGKSHIDPVFKKKHFQYTNNTDGSLRWIFSKRKISTALSFYSKANLRSKLVAAGLKMMNLFGIRQGKFTVYAKQDLKIETALNSVEFDDYAIFTGSEGYGRTAVVALSANKRITHFAKIAYDEFGKRLIANERLYLKTQHKGTYDFIVTPEVVDQNDENVLITTNVTQNKVRRSTKFGVAHSHFIATIFRKTRLTYKIALTNYWDRILNNCDFIKNQKVQQELRKLMRLLEQAKQNINTNQYIVTTLSHADFTPWNLKFNKTHIYVYDWEHANTQTPAFFDLFHFHFQTGLLIKKQSYQQILKAIEASCQEIELKYIIEQYDIDIQFYIKLYLLKMISFQAGNMLEKEAFSAMDLKKIKLYEEALASVTVRTTELVHREVFIKEFYAQLKRTPHAMLKFVAGSFEKLSHGSDLDIAVLKGDIKAITHYAKNHLLVNKSSVIHKSFMTIVELFFEDGSYLSIDLIHQFKRKTVEMMPIEPLLVSARPNEHGIMVPAKRFDLEYAFLFYSLNGASIPLKYYQFFKANTFQNNAFKYISHKYKLVPNAYEDLFKGQVMDRQTLENKVLKQPFQTLKSKLKNNLNYYKDTAKSILQNRGFIVTLSGVDGAGKSTILEAVQGQIQSQFRREVVLLRHRPAVLPILSSIKYGGSKNAEKRASEKLPRTGTNKSQLSSLLRFAYYYTDYMIGQVYVYFKYIIRGKIVLYDRYYFDFIADCERSNIRMNKKFIKALYRFVTKPKLNVLLWADASVIYSRKQELEPATITRLTQDYKNLFNAYHKKYTSSIYKVIKNVNLDATVNTIMRAFTKAI